ncbi:NADH:ubiquinone oxidoreductase [Alkalispirochaeta sphaeroplastigenens]|uniref:NADH:ubiquinone oxidoreductase n=1 Tax=Alkalispirochaeta sphaeroplastigenens TaxID=1187066 RepID=A0A2S4JWQ4_9SPIO|nr:NAD(P)H-dependent oxidoreductase subunit E [Alkalispirochaeta sphaeroplastigenens]POR03930.1 NADH:ubiquinone oxidoreductase [Alkalispirochaeta sphaeroplastigenens]
MHQETASISLDPVQQQQLQRIAESHRDKKGALIPVLQDAQGAFGFLSREVLQEVSRLLEIPFSVVSGVVTFYSYFSTTPRGKNTLRVCLGTACYVRNGKQVLADLQKELSVAVGETTGDRCFTLEIGRCFGACGLAPVVMVNDDVHQRVKAARIREMLAPYRACCTDDAGEEPREKEEPHE